MSSLDLFELLGEPFLKASRLEASARALEGLGSCGLIPTFVRYSQLHWAWAFRAPVLRSIQRATFGRLHLPPAWRCFLHERLPKLRLPPVEQGSQFGTGILVPAITEPFDPFGPVAPCNFRLHSCE